MDMKWRLSQLGFLVLLCLMMGSCVSKKKYAELENLKNNIQALLDENTENLEIQEEANGELEGQMWKAQAKTDSLKQADAEKAAKLADQQVKMEEMASSCKDLEGRYKQLKSQSSGKIQDLIDELEQLQNDLAQREQRLGQLQGELARRDSAMSALRNSINEALLGFPGDEISVERKNGKVYVTLANKLLFASGSTTIDEKGKGALQELGKALAQQTDITVWVEGHTDDVPVSNLGDIKDNWDLSVMRSTEVVRILVEFPKRIFTPCAT